MTRHKHLLLLAVVIAWLVTQPLVARQATAARVAYDVLAIAIALGVLSVVFEFRWERVVAVVLALPALALTLARYVHDGRSPGPAAFWYSLSVALFIGFAVAVIIRGIFVRHQGVRLDDVVGAFSGYLLLGVAWGNIYAGVDVVAPGSFSVNSEIRWQLDDWHLRRALFHYVSFATMAGLGYDDVTAATPLANTLTWLEVMAAQFYLAVVVAQIVGLKLAELIKRRA
jgi:hypothetical protein